MPKPLINTSIEDLQRQSSKGAMSPSNPRSSGNLMPGPSAISSSPMRAPSGGPTAGLGANPSRTGMPPISSGGYKPIAGSPSPMSAAVTPPHMHALTKASLTHLANQGMRHPNHDGLMAHANSGIAKFKKAQAPSASKFGALGAAFKPRGGIGGGMSPMGSGIPGASMGGGQPPSMQRSGSLDADDGY